MKIKDIFRLTFESMRTRIPRIIINIAVLSILIVGMTFALSAGSLGKSQFHEQFTRSVSEKGVIMSIDYDLDSYDSVRGYVNDNYVPIPIEECIELRQMQFRRIESMIFGNRDFAVSIPNTKVPTVQHGEAYNSEDLGKIWIPQSLFDYVNSKGYDENSSLAIGDEVALYNGFDKKETFTLAGIIENGTCIISPKTAIDIGIDKDIRIMTQYKSPLFDTVHQFENHMEVMFRGIENLGGNAEINDGASTEGLIPLSYIEIISLIIAIALAALACYAITNSIKLSIYENAKFFALLSAVGIRDKSIVAMVAIEVAMILLASVAIASLLVFAFTVPFLALVDMIILGIVSEFGVFALTFEMPIIATVIIVVGMLVLTITATTVYMIAHSRKGVLEVIKDE